MKALRIMRPPIEYGKSELMFEGEKIALVAVGSMVQTAVQVHEKHWIRN